MKHIIIPVDFSANALLASQIGYQIAKQVNGKITILHAYQPFQSNFQSAGANLKDSIRSEEEAKAELASFSEKFNSVIENDGKIEVEFLAERGLIQDALEVLHKKDPIDLVIMGTTGASGIKFHLGSNTYEIARKTSFPLLIVPPNTQVIAPKNIGYFTDFQLGDLKVLHSLSSLFEESTIHYHLIHIIKDKVNLEGVTEKLQALRTELQHNLTGINLQEQVFVGDEHIDTINSITDQTGTDLIALCIVKKSFWEKFREKSLAKEIILKAGKPIFVYN